MYIGDHLQTCSKQLQQIPRYAARIALKVEPAQPEPKPEPADRLHLMPIIPLIVRLSFYFSPNLQVLFFLFHTQD